MTTTQITTPAASDVVRYFNLNGREVTNPRTRAEYANMHRESWERAFFYGIVDTFACKVCKAVLPTGHAHTDGCQELLALWP